MSGARSRHGTAVLVAAIVYVVLLSSTFVAVKVGLRNGWPPITLLSVRFLIAGAVMTALVRWAGGGWPVTRRAWGRLVMLGLMNMVLPAVFNFLALRRASAGTAAITMATNPLLLTLIAPKLLGEKITLPRLVGILLGFGGVVFVMIVRVGAGGRADTPLGIVLLMTATVCMVVGTTLFKLFPPRESLLVVNAVQQLVGGFVLIPPSVLFEDHAHAVLNVPVIAALLYMALVVSVGAALLWFWLLGRGEASVVSGYYFLAPISGLLLGALLLGERFGVRECIGLGLVSAGIILIRRRPRAS